MSKERLEEIERLRGIDRRLIAFEHTDWLIEQVGRVQKLEKTKSDAIKQIDVTQRRNKRLEERVQELERQNKALELEVDGWFNKANEIHESTLRQDKVIDKFRQQNKRYREALEEISKPIYGITYADMFAVKQIARKALGG